MTLPSYKNPPLKELVLSVQFNALAAFNHIHVGALWECFRANFPRVEYQAPLPPSFETFGLSQIIDQQMQIRMMVQPDLPRLWFLSEAGTEILHFQRDQFIHNWRKVDDGSIYPRYESVRSHFAREIAILNEFIFQNGLGEIVPTQCEVTYINKYLHRSRPTTQLLMFLNVGATSDQTYWDQ